MLQLKKQSQGGFLLCDWKQLRTWAPGPWGHLPKGGCDAPRPVGKLTSDPGNGPQLSISSKEVETKFCQIKALIQMKSFLLKNNSS